MPDNDNIYLSVIIPLRDEEATIEGVHKELTQVLDKLEKPCEIIYVDDGSTDGSARILKRLHESDPKRVIVIRLRRNFGKSSAMAAGMEHARGTVLATLDADGQDDPAALPGMIEKLDNTDYVSGWRRKRRDNALKNLSSRLYNFAARVLTGVKLHDINCGVKVFKREVVRDLELTGDLHRIIPLIVAWKGFRVAEVEVAHRRRAGGRSKYGVCKLPVGFLDLLMFGVLSRYSRKPGHFLGSFGLLVFLAGLVISGYFLVIKILGGSVEPRYPLFVLGIVLLVVGLQMIFTGFLAELVNYNLSTRAEYSIAEKLGGDAH